MISLIDATLKDAKDISVSSLHKFVSNESIEGLNWWNSNEFPHYLKGLHRDPWEILDSIINDFDDKKIIIELRINQLSNFIPFDASEVDRFLSLLPKKDNIYVKIYDPLNNLKNIKNTINIALKNKLHVIGGIFLRPDSTEYPNCHENLIKLYADTNIKNINLVEPLGLLKQNNLSIIIKKITQIIQDANIGLSLKHLELQHSILLGEALANGVTEIEYSLIPRAFGLPSLPVIQEVLDFVNLPESSKKIPLKTLEEFNGKKTSDDSLNGEKFELLHIKSGFPNIPVNSIQSLRDLKYFSNLPYDLETMLQEVTKTQHELGNPPLIEPFYSIIVSQAVFRLQNASQSLQTLPTLKYIAGFWGEINEKLTGDFKDFVPLAETLKKKSKIFKFPTLESDSLSTIKNISIDELQAQKNKILFDLFPKEADYFFNDYSQKPKNFDVSQRKNLAILMKAYFESNPHQSNNFSLKVKPVDTQQNNANSNEFRWRYLSRLFQMGKF